LDKALFIVIQIMLVLSSFIIEAAAFNLGNYGFPRIYLFLISLSPFILAVCSFGLRIKGKTITKKIEKIVEKKIIIRKDRTVPIIQGLIIAGLMAVVFSAYSLTLIYAPKEGASPEEMQRAENMKAFSIIALILIGGMGLGPPFIFVGWLMADPLHRAKTKRTIFKKNYGVVNFVSRGKKILTKIKDFNCDTIWVKNAVWMMEPGRIFKKIRSEDSSEMEESWPITEKNIHDQIGIPEIYLDIDTMRPLEFDYMQKTPISPIDAGSTLKGWVFNELAKNLFVKRTLSIMLIIAIVAAACSAYIAFLSYQGTEDMKPVLKSIQDTVNLMKQTQGPTVIEQGK
jgi:hypothetical protein